MTDTPRRGIPPDTLALALALRIDQLQARLDAHTRREREERRPISMDSPVRTHLRAELACVEETVRFLEANLRIPALRVRVEQYATRIREVRRREEGSPW